MFPAKTSLVKPCQSLRTSADLRSNFSFEVYSADAFLLAASEVIKIKTPSFSPHLVSGT